MTTLHNQVLLEGAKVGWGKLEGTIEKSGPRNSRPHSKSLVDWEENSRLLARGLIPFLDN